MHVLGVSHTAPAATIGRARWWAVRVLAILSSFVVLWVGASSIPVFAAAPAAQAGTAAHAELVDAENERELLALFRSVPRRSQDLILDLFGALIASKEGKRGKRTPVSRITF